MAYREQDKEATVYIGNLDERVTDSIVWELMLQAGRIQNVHLPKDRVTQTHQGYGFVEFTSEEDADYAAKIMNGIKLWNRQIRVNKASADKQKTVEVGAELFVGNLDPMVDEKILYETFGRFGTFIAQPKIARDDANISKGYGFISFADFEASDAAILNMNGQFLMNKDISVQYAYKKDGKGERHGDEAERMLAHQARKHNVQPEIQPIPPQLFQQVPMPAAIPNGNYGQSNGLYAPQPPSRPSQTPLPPPPSGLPARPPPSQGGYGGPANVVPPGFGGAPPPMGFQPPQGFPHGGPPPFAPPPPGFAPAGMPPGFPPPGFPRR